MTVSRRDALAAGLVAAPVVALAAVAGAQTPRRQQPVPGTFPVTPPARGAAGSAQGEDALLGACLLFRGRRQIEVCKFALDKSQNQEVKAFLNSEVQEHETVRGELQTKFGLAYPTPAGNNNGGNAANPNGAGNANPAMNQTVAVGGVQVNGAAANIFAIEGEVVEQCIASYKTKMAKYQGVKLEKAIIGDQLSAHGALLDEVLVFQRHASPAMLPALKTAQDTIEKHIATCEQIMERLDAQGNNGQNRNNNDR